MRRRDPRRLLRRRGAPARVRLLGPPESTTSADGAVTTHQAAEVLLPRAELERMWTAEYLERLARTYWRYLSRISLGVLRVLYTETSREVAVVGRPLVLLRFRAPEYTVSEGGGAVTWRIDRGLLVAPWGRGQGFLRIAVDRLPAPVLENAPDVAAVVVSSEVVNFYPMLAGRGWFSRVGRILHGETQMRIHVLVTNGFLRSLADLDLAPSVVGAMRPPRARPRLRRAGARAARLRPRRVSARPRP